MPQKLKPNSSYPYVLREERGEEDPVVFFLRVLAKKDEADFLRLNSEWIATKDADERERITNELLARAIDRIKGIEGVERGDDPKLSEILTIGETWELIHGAREGAALSVDERKKFVSPCRSDGVNSAEDAPPGDAQAESAKTTPGSLIAPYAEGETRIAESVSTGDSA